MKIKESEAQKLKIIRQVFVLELIAFISVGAYLYLLFGHCINFGRCILTILIYMIPAQIPLAFIVIVYHKLINPPVVKEKVLYDETNKLNHTLNIFTKTFLIILKWIGSYVLSFIVLFYVWALYCFHSTTSEAGQAMGLVIGLIYILIGLTILFIIVGVLKFQKNKKFKTFQRTQSPP
ncbi:MAG: hypothetical protein K8S27_04700 [Candidatus Omnitrophica bacterium]|nr:hypothetical protein [Candidatus Omnitrophota bacterium]